MWDLPRPRIEPMFPALAGRCFTTEPQGKPQTQFLRLTLFWCQNQTKTIQEKENYRSVSLMNIDTEILDKMFPNWIQQYVKNKWVLSQECKALKINQCNLLYWQSKDEKPHEPVIQKKHLIKFNIQSWTSIKYFYNIHKSSHKLGTGDFLKLIKGIYNTTCIIPSGKDWMLTL